MHTQQYEALAVAIVREVSGWYPQRWWRIPPMSQAVTDGHIREPEQLVSALLPWNRELPHRHHIYLSSPASGALQKKLPRPIMTLREPEQTTWLSGSMTRELDMASDVLYFDYSEDTLNSVFNVTAAQSKEISAFPTFTQTLKMQVTATTPGASALQQFILFLSERQQCPVWRDDAQRLWATRSARGRKLTGDIGSIGELATTLSLPTIAIA